jgi:sugar phosphate isomerase/epimerase
VAGFSWPLGTATSGLAGPESLRACRDAGIEAVELDLFGGGRDAGTAEGLASFAAEAAAVRAAGLRLWSVHLPFGGAWDISAAAGAEGAVDRLLGLLPVAARWGAVLAVVHGSAEPVRPEERGGRLERAAASLRRLQAAAAAAGLQLALECLPRTCLGNRTSEVADLVERVPGLRVCCDVNHLFHETPAAFIRALGSHLVTLHVSDNDGRDERHWLPGEGSIDWGGVLRALADVGYAGPFLFEVHPRPPADLAAAWARLRGSA